VKPLAIAAATVVVAGGAIYGVIHWFTASAQREHDAAMYPIVLPAGDAAQLERDSADWQHSRAQLAKNLRSFDPTKVVLPPATAAACPIAHDPRAADLFTFSNTLADDVLTRVNAIATAADRKRFATVDDRNTTVDRAHLDGLVVVAYRENNPPRNDGEHGFTAGSRTGTAYAFDRTGTLVCACAFGAMSSERVHYWVTRAVMKGGGAVPETNLDEQFDNMSVDDALAKDIDDATAHAIAAGLRSLR
jgi:hypothetical protein